ncbi:MAG TPA: hypothetical protein VHB79_04140 [Polyangiaceae bacterium]|nr:hypothetical protein [Polyangiaceae bacterium]
MRVDSEPDRIDPRFLLGVGAVSLAVTALCCGLAWLVLVCSRSDSESRAFHHTRAARPPAEINQVEANLLDGSSSRPDAAAARRRLQSFGWSERERGLVRVPLDRAFELYESGQRAAGTPTKRSKGP